jgi:hypothetical protein
MKLNSIIKKSFVAAIALTTLGSFAIESAEASRHDNRQQRQRARIHQGKKDGSLTRGEARRIEAGQRKIQRMENRAEADGVVTAKEKMKIEKAQDKQSKRIAKLKNNDKVRNENAATPATPAVPAQPGEAPAQPAVPAEPAAEATGN